jgi:predicted helicase
MTVNAGWYYYSEELNEDLYQLDKFLPEANSLEQYISFVTGNRLEFGALAGSRLPNYAIYSLDPAQFVPFRFREDGMLRDNVTNWALAQFQDHYENGKKLPRAIDKRAIFNYVYGALHDPVYREKYGQNLKRDFPRIPFYDDFWKWTEWGEKLMALHLGYEKVDPWALERVDVLNKTAKKSGVTPKVILRASEETGSIQLDSDTQLTGVPKNAWEYRLGNRAALQWILDQYKEKAPKDPIVREKFNTYRFADYKDHVIDLLKRVTRVSVETQAIIEEMKAAKNAR